MKKLLYTIVFLILILLPSKAMADVEFNFSVNAANSGVVASSGDTNKITVFISSSSPINSCSFSLISPQSGAQFSEITEEVNGWKSTESNGSYTISSEEGLTDADNKIIAYVEYTVTGSATITFSNITCSTGSSSGTHNDVNVNLKVADSIIVKVDGSVVDADIVPNLLPANKNSVLLSVTSSNQTIQDSIKIYAKDTASGDVLICDSSQASNCTVNFTSNYFCTSDVCNTLKIEKGAGDNIKFGIEASGGVERSFFLLKEVTQAVYSDSSIATLKVYGVEIPLEKGKTDYTDIRVPNNTENISVQATLSDPEHYAWDEEDNPNKYDFLASTVNLIVRPKDPNALGANESAYAIHITFEGGDPITPSPSSSSSSQNDTPIIISSSSSSSRNSNPQTGISEIIIALVLVGSLIFSVIMYRKNMNSYE